MKAYLVLCGGAVFEGERIGAARDSVGELVFTTGSVGYLETLTDPSYAGQIIMQTFPLIGNYGVIPEDFEGKCACRGYVVRELCDTPSNFRSQEDLDTFLRENNIPGICGVDTRELTRIIRSEGTVNAAIVSDPSAVTHQALSSYRVSDTVDEVGCREIALFPAECEKYRVALLDFGAKRNILRSLSARGASVTVFPHTTRAEDILAGGFDGVMLSNGPGDPADNTFEIAQIAKLLGKIPLFGICLGHQLTAIAAGGTTEKLKFGHRGANQPVRDLADGRTRVTSQNHGYAVVSSSLPPSAKLRFVNANDGSCEGIDYPELRAFTVQFHPEACAGPHDMSFLFDRFTDLMKEG